MGADKTNDSERSIADDELVDQEFSEDDDELDESDEEEDEEIDEEEE